MHVAKNKIYGARIIVFISFDADITNGAAIYK
jgi:hypothetical protein